MKRIPLGVGIGYRHELASLMPPYMAQIDWFELQADRFVPAGPRQRDELLHIAAERPCVPHFVDMSIGSPGPLSMRYLESMSTIVDILDAPWFSDHLCYTRIDGLRLGHLTPLYRTRQLASEIAEKANIAQDRVGRRLLLENISYPLDVGGEISESEFVSIVLEESDCGLLLDVANVYVNSRNHGFDPYEYLLSLPLNRVEQFHVAGHHHSETGLLDSHDSAVAGEVWQLLDFALGRTPGRSVLLERDARFPGNFDEISMDLKTMREIIHRHE